MTPTPARASDDCQWLAGPEGYFYFLTPEGDLHRYDPTINEVIKTVLGEVDHIKLGADKQVYACMNARVVRLMQDGSISDGGIQSFGENIHDVAASSNGSDLFVLNRNGLLFHRDLKSEESEVRHARWTAVLPLWLPRSRGCVVTVWGGVSNGRQCRLYPLTFEVSMTA